MGRRTARTVNGVYIPLEWVPYVTQVTILEDDPKGPEFELIHKEYWNVQTYVDNTTRVLNFAAGGAIATEDLGNFSFPLQESYLLKAMGWYVRAGIETDDTGAAGVFPSMVRDVQLLMNTGLLRVKIGRKDYGPYRLHRLAAGAGVWGVVASTGAEAVALTHDWAQPGMPTPDSIFKLAIPLVIPANTQTVMSMEWPAGAVDLTANRVIELNLAGITASPLQ